MKVYVYPADEAGCGYYRMIWPAETLQQIGHDVVIVRPKERHAAFQGVLDNHGRMIDVRIPADADVIVLQRITHSYLIKGIELIRQKGIAVVVDMDDDLAAINPNNPAFMIMHPAYGAKPEHNWENARRACEAASFVVVSTPALLPRYAPHGRGAVLYNCVPQRYLDIPRVDSTVIGWGGSMHSHPDDPYVIGSGVAQLMDETTFQVIGPADGIRNAFRLPNEPKATGPQNILTAWPYALASLGIGVAPLSDTRFNAGKSWLKPLEYSAVGVPWVASPRAEYARLHDYGSGLLANKPKQWASQLRRLVRESALREDLSEAGRNVARLWTIEGNAWRWAEAWEEAYKIEH